MATPSRWPQRLVRRPPSSSTTAPNSGKASSSHDSFSAPVAATVCNVVIPSVLQQVGVVHRRGPARPEDRHQDREADDDLRGRHHHHEERDDLPVQVPVHPGERDEREVARVQHQLDAHEHDDGVAPHEHADAADHEQDHGQGHVVDRAHDSASVVADAGSSGRTGGVSAFGSRGASVWLTESSEVLPSGSSAATAAVISSAPVTSNGNTYVVKISLASPVRLSTLFAAVVLAAGPMAACPMPRIKITNRPIAASPAAARWPLIVSMTESDELMPISMMTNRNSISTAPVYTMICTKARKGAPCMAYMVARQSITTARMQKMVATAIESALVPDGAAARTWLMAPPRPLPHRALPAAPRPARRPG